MIFELLAAILCVSLVATWLFTLVRHVKLPVPSSFRNRLVGLSVVGLLAALVSPVLLVSDAGLVPVAVALGVGMALFPLTTRLMDRWTAQGRLQLVREGRDAYTGLPSMRRRPPDSPGPGL